jgi:hypothetical protein
VGGKIVEAFKKSMPESIKSIKGEGGIDRFYGKDIIHNEFVPRGQTVNGLFYLEFMKRLRDPERRKRPEGRGWRNKTWMMHHYNTPAYTSLLLREYLSKYETTVAPQQPHTPYLALADFFLFPRLKFALEVRRFRTTEDLRGIPQIAGGGGELEAVYIQWREIL